MTQAITPADAPGSRRFSRKPVVTGLIAAAILVAGSPSSRVTEPVLVAVMAVAVGIMFAVLAATVQVLAHPTSSPGAAPLPGQWPIRGASNALVSSASTQSVIARYASLIRSTDPADRKAAEEAITLIYRDAGLDPPPCVWVRSPAEAVRVREVVHVYERLQERGSGGGQADWNAVSGFGKDSAGPIAQDLIVVSELLGAADLSAFANTWFGPIAVRAMQLCSSLDAITIATRDAITFALGEEADPFKLPAGNLAGLPQDIHFLAAAECLAANIPQLLPPIRTRALTTLVNTCGGWWPTSHAVVLTERPVVARRDHQGRLNDRDGAALQYGDGWKVFAVDGVAMPRRAFVHPETLKLDEILGEQNSLRRTFLVQRYGSERYLEAVAQSLDLILAEPTSWTRRAALERFGVTRFVQESGVVIDSDLDRQGQMRRLWRAGRPNVEPIVMIEVVNSTPEPDGTRHHYWLRVPPRVRGCQEAVAWTFGLDATAYEPVFES